MSISLAHKAVILAIGAHALWPATALALGVGVPDLPSPPEAVQDALDRAVNDVAGKLEDALDALQKAAPGPAERKKKVPTSQSSRPPAAAGDHRAGERRAQAGGDPGSRKDDVEELVASGDEIRDSRDAGAADPASRAGASLPFTGLDPTGLVRTGLVLVVVGLGLLNAPRRSSRPAGARA